MKVFLKHLIFSLIIILLFFAAVEGLFRLFSPLGSSSFIERRIMEQNLSFRKHHDEFRIFCFGESTMHGHHLYPESTIPVWLDRYLKPMIALDKQDRISVYNFGRLGEDSDFIKETVRQLMSYRPDVIIVNSAHNDFGVEKRHLFFSPTWRDKFKNWFSAAARSSAFLSFLNRLNVRRKLIRNQKKTQSAHSIEDQIGFEEDFGKDYDPERDLIVPYGADFNRIVDKWYKNILVIMEMARKKNISVIFIESVANCKDFAPYESRHLESLTDYQVRDFALMMELSLRQHQAGDIDGAVAFLLNALQIDPQYAEARYRLGKLYEIKGDMANAIMQYRMAHNFDYLPMRAPNVINEIYEKIRLEQRPGVFVVPTEQIFCKNSFSGFIDLDLVYDNVHPTIKGQSLIAEAIVHIIVDQHFLPEMFAVNIDKMPSYQTIYGDLALTQDFWFRFHFNLAKSMGSFFDQRIAHAKKAVEYRPQSVKAKRILAWLYYLKGDQQSAIKEYEKIYLMAPDALSHVFKFAPDIKKRLEAL